MQAGTQFGWEIALDTQLVTYSGDQRTVLGFVLPASLEDRWAIVHPDDREPSQHAYRQAMEAGVPFVVEQRLFVPGGEGRIIWVSIVGKFFGAPPRFVGTTRNVTAQKEAEAARRASEAQQVFLLALSDALRDLRDPADVQATAARVLGERIGVDRAYYVAVDEARSEYVVEREWHRSGAPSHARRYALDAWPMPWLADGRPRRWDARRS